MKSQDSENLKLACKGYAIASDGMGDDLNSVLMDIRADNSMDMIDLDLIELFTLAHRARYSPLATEGARQALEWLGADTSKFT